MTTVTYLAASRSLLAQARAELDAGDLRQASEKGWGAGPRPSSPSPGDGARSTGRTSPCFRRCPGCP